MKPIAALLLAATLGCAAPDARPVAEDVVCLCKGALGCVRVRVDGGTPRSEFRGKTYYFCAEGCKEEFDRDPERGVREAEGKR